VAVVGRGWRGQVPPELRDGQRGRTGAHAPGPGPPEGDGEPGERRGGTGFLAQLYERDRAQSFRGGTVLGK